VSDRGCISFFSDLGSGSEQVGVCVAVMSSIAPLVNVVSITHDIAPFDVRMGSLTLVRAAQYLPAGVVLAAVDPGSGTDRRCVAVEVEGGILVGPDNGLLAPAVAMLGGPQRIVALTNTDFQLDSPGRTLAARDVLAPAAAYLATGVDLAELGPVVDPTTLTPGLLPLADSHDHDDGSRHVTGEVLAIDRFGNCQLNIDLELLDVGSTSGEVALELGIGEAVRRVRIVPGYADARPGELVALVDGFGLLSLAMDRASAAHELKARVGVAVTLASAPGRARAGVDVPVTLQERR
jgi:S-adenosylmethionine hydrolase